MKPLVDVIAHTSFVGVPPGLLPGTQESPNGEALAEYLGGIHEIRLKNQDLGTPAERLIECAGRACYDSYGKGRPSDAYHKHIMEVDHGSVTEHVSLTFFLRNISRGLTHELVRHRVGVAISQRSTRYVDESSSDWVDHPLIEAFCATEKPVRAPNGELTELMLAQRTNHTKETAKRVYRVVVERLETWLIERGTDKFTARKQARGAARGYLGNALMTEMVWTCNLRAFKTIMKQRANAAADAEIRALAILLYEKALPYWPTYLGVYNRRPSPDGLADELFISDPKDEKITALEAEIAALKAR